MKVLQTLHFFLPKHSAGAEVYTYRLSRFLREAGHEVSLFFTEKVHTERDHTLLRRRFDGLDCHVLVNNLLYQDFRGTFDCPVTEQRFDEVLDQVRPDVVHVQHLMLTSLGLVARARARGIPVVMTLHDFWLYCPRMGQLLDRDGALCDGPADDKCASCLAGFKFGQSPMEARMIRGLASIRRRTGLDLGPAVEWWRSRRGRGGHAVRPDPTPGPPVEHLAARRQAVAALVEQVDRFLVPSRTVRDRCVGYGLDASKAVLIPYGFTPPGTGGAPPGSPRGEGELRVGYLGTLAPHKGVHVLLEAFARAALPGARLRVCGGGRYYPDYERDLRQRAQGMPVTFDGFVANEGLAAVLGEIDVLVVPSLWLENAPVVIQEARWAGVPVIASRLGGMEEAVRHDVDGLLFEPGDAGSLAATLQRVAGDPALLSRLAAAAPEPMPMQGHVAEVLRHYREVCDAEVTR